MDIFEIIENLESMQVYTELSVVRQILPLNYKDYVHIYNEFKFNDTHHFIDTEEKLNFVVRLNSNDSINNIINSKTSLYVSRDADIPIIEFIFENDNRNLNYKFKFDLFNNRNLISIKQLLKNKVVYLHFLTQNNDLLYKSYSCVIELDEFTLNKFRYFIEFCYNGHCPRRSFEGFRHQNSYYLSFDWDENVLQELLEITEKLQKWGSRDVFTVSVDNNQYLNLLFQGITNNFEYYKKELSKKFKLIDEGEIQTSGKPFFQYSQGLLYFFKT